MLLDHLGQSAAAETVERAVASLLAEARVRTPDLGGTSRTEEVTAAVVTSVAGRSS
jgi:tartrate dehydrogenase/decarboxylase/D-malate dehydrogenase